MFPVSSSSSIVFVISAASLVLFLEVHKILNLPLLAVRNVAGHLESIYWTQCFCSYTELDIQIVELGAESCGTLPTACISLGRWRRANHPYPTCPNLCSINSGYLGSSGVPGPSLPLFLSFATIPHIDCFAGKPPKNEWAFEAQMWRTDSWSPGSAGSPPLGFPLGEGQDALSDGSVAGKVT